VAERRRLLVTTNRTQLILQALADAGLQTPELRDYYEFHRALLEILAHAQADISGALPAEVVKASRMLAVHSSPSECPAPLLAFDHLSLEGEDFAKLVRAVGRILSDYDPAFEGQGLPSSPAECLRLGRRRFEEGQACAQPTPVHPDGDEFGRDVDGDGPEVVPTLADLSVDLALRPYLEWAAQQLALPAEAEGAWRQGYCPICGGAPDLASLGEESGARFLLCSRCNTQWAYHRLGCPFCGTTDHTRLFYYPSDDRVYRLTVCRECRRYLKTIDLRQVHRAVLLPLERLTTLSMDAAALEAGYR